MVWLDNVSIFNVWLIWLISTHVLDHYCRGKMKHKTSEVKWNISEWLRQLTETKFFQPVDTNLTENRERRSNTLSQICIQRLKSMTVYRYLQDRECKTPNIYFLPKIHKAITRPMGRPIVSANGCPTEKISNFVDHFLNPPSTHNKSYVKDTTHFLKIIRDTGVVPPD